MIGNQA